MSKKKATLDTYRDKRDFRESPEPSGGTTRKRKSKNPIFVIQEHDASTHHYDFRLEINGVLKSWAIPKGISTDPREKRLAMPTEDHPIDYADFEGTIPENEYGGGTVIVWDAGAYRNIKEDDDGNEVPVDKCYDQGQLEVRLEGKKIKGGYALIRTNKGKDERWLLIKMKDDEADARRNPTSTEPESVLSGKTLKEMRKEHEEKKNGDKDDS
jgi:DNA ligase D-like protein (predicted 3'-phosphoesterase)